jgi:hypothetical protein
VYVLLGRGGVVFEFAFFSMFPGDGDDATGPGILSEIFFVSF